MLKPLKILVEILIRDKNEYRHHTTDGGVFITDKDDRGVSFLLIPSPKILKDHFPDGLEIINPDPPVFNQRPWTEEERATFIHWKMRSYQLSHPTSIEPS